MVVMTPREKWSDERLDDLNRKVDDGFARLDGEIKDLRRGMDARFDAMNNSINARFDALNRNLIGGLFVLVATFIGSNAF